MCSLRASPSPCSLPRDRRNVELHSSQQQNKDQTATQCHISVRLLLLSCSAGEISCGRQTAGIETLSFSSRPVPGSDGRAVSGGLRPAEPTLCPLVPAWENKAPGASSDLAPCVTCRSRTRQDQLQGCCRSCSAHID